MTLLEKNREKLQHRVSGDCSAGDLIMILPPCNYKCWAFIESLSHRTTTQCPFTISSNGESSFPGFSCCLKNDLLYIYSCEESFITLVCTF